jgi:hypothetical protein
MGTQFLYDELNSFGTVSAAGAFPNVIALGKATVERMTVDLKGPLTAGTAIVLKVQESDSEGGTYTDLVTGPARTFQEINQAGYQLPVPKEGKKFLKASVSGTGIAGTLEAVINPKIGK